jgi:lipoprotein LprG
MNLGPFTAAAALLALAACTGVESPPADDVLPDAAQAMAEVANVHFSVTVEGEGEVPGLDIFSATGTVTADGSAEGDAVVSLSSAGRSVEYVIIGDDAYVRAPSGVFEQVEVGGDELPFDPTVILDPNRGIASLLAADPWTEPRETDVVDGTEAYCYKMSFDGAAFTAFLPAAGDWNNATLWFDTQTLRVMRAEFSRGDQTITLKLSDYDADVTIEHP